MYGFYICTEKYQDAVAYKNQRREIEPAIYNRRRLVELPIPNITPINRPNSQNVPIEELFLQIESEDQVANAIAATDDIFDDVSAQNDDDNGVENHVAPIEDVVRSETTNIKEEFVPIFGIGSANNIEFIELLQEEELVTIDDDISMMVTKNNAFPMPLNSTANDIIKRENDTISGNYPLNENVSCHFT